MTMAKAAAPFALMFALGDHDDIQRRSPIWVHELPLIAGMLSG